MIDIIVFHRYETPVPPFPNTFIHPSNGLTARLRRQSDVVCCSPTIIEVINVDRENPMCARAKRVTRLQKRSWVRERDADAALIGCEGWEHALFREVVDLFPLFFVRQRNRVHRIYRRDVIYDEHCLRTFIWFHKSFLREMSFLIGVYLRTVKKGISHLADILTWVWDRVKNSSGQRSKIVIKTREREREWGINVWCKNAFEIQF